MSSSGVSLYALLELKFNHSRVIPAIAFLIVLGGFCLARLFDLSLLERLELVSYDLRVQAAQAVPEACATNLGFIAIDDDTISAVRTGLLGAPYGLYWPRHVYGRILEEAEKEGAKVVAFDVLFGELRPDLGGLLRGDEIIESDDFLALQLRDAGNVLLAAKPDLIPPDLFLTNAAALGDISTEKDPDGVLRRVKAFQDYPEWHWALKSVEASPDYGVDLSKALIETDRVVLPRNEADPIVVPLDENGMFSLADFYGEDLPPGIPEKALPRTTRRVWNMGVLLAARGLGLDMDDAEVDLDQGWILLHGNGVKRAIPVDHTGRFYIDWSMPVDDPVLFAESAQDLLKRSIARRGGSLQAPAQTWSERLVVIGSIATGNDLSDMGATPVDKNTYLVSEYWNIANSILVNRFIRRGSPLEEMIIMLVAGAFAGFLALWLRPLIAFALTMGLLASYVGMAFVLFTQHRLWLPLFLPVGAALSLYLVITTWRVVFEQGERRRVKSVFSKVVSPNVVTELLGAKELALGGARREITIFFADVRGFTALTDRAQQVVEEEVGRRGLAGEEAKALRDQQAAETLATVNLYLARVADVIKKHIGTLDKYIGDCVMAFWGAPTPNHQHALFCVRAAIDAQRAIAEINEQRRVENLSRPDPKTHLPLLSLGSGINTGEATVGLMGSDAHILSYTVFGREVNVASRLEGVSGRDRIIISETTFKHLESDDPRLAAQCIALESVSVKGIREQVQIYEVPWRVPAPDPCVTGAEGRPQNLDS